MIRRCVPETEWIEILENCHLAPYGGDFSGKRTATKVLQSGFYWPTLLKDAYRFVRGCNHFQRTGNISRKQDMPKQGILEVELFDIWGIDFMSYFPQSYGK